MDSNRIQRYRDKFTKFDIYHDQLSEWLISHPIESLDEKKDIHWIYAILHVFQNIAELISDISAMVLKDSGKIVKDNYTNYKMLYDQSVISKSSLDTLKRITGLRNRIAHEYNGLIYDLAWKAMEDFIERFKFIREDLYKWLTSNS